MTKKRWINAGLGATALLVTLGACHRGVVAPATGIRVTQGNGGVRATTPDDEKTLFEDTRRALRWRADAERVMAIHTTTMNSLALSSSCNVYFSNGAFFESRPAIFLARHYGMSGVKQYLELSDHIATARSFQALGDSLVRANEAWNLARRIVPAVMPSAVPSPGASAANAVQSAYQPQTRFFASSRAFLLRLDDHAPEWWVFANQQKFVINAVSRGVQGPTPQLDPVDPLQQGLDVELQRAAAVWLPSHPFKANDRSEPSPTN